MVQHSVYSQKMSPHQLSLLEHALRQLSRIDPSSWDQIPPDLHPSFARYTCSDPWTGRPDLLTLREAALCIVRDAIARTGEFAESTTISAGASHHY